MAEQKREVAISLEDRARMSRLYEEAAGRLEEMSLIVSRNLGLPSGNHVAKFQPITRAPATDAPETQATLTFKGAAIVCTDTGCGCYEFDTGICFVCP